MNDLRVGFYAEDDCAWIGLPPINSEPCAVPRWIREFFPEAPWRAALAGGESGYLILEWPAGFDLTELPDDPAIDVQLRYFAPQHGVPEDTATGSAMRVLATYWMNRELNDGLHAYQCSPYGGELRSRIRDGYTWVGGRVVCTQDSVAHAA